MGQSKGCIPWNKGKTNIFSKKALSNISEKLKKYKGEKSWNWKGGKTIMNGRVYLACPDHPRTKGRSRKRLAESILVIEKSLGRYLKTGEIVHHINGVPMDNRVKNLIVMTRAKHNTLHKHAKRRSNELHA